ncbi:MAG: thioredoxin family protein [Bryobacteraceae bacterium]|nr:thioredoxin family protein [Bryobacteraceae bacterium]
MSTSVRLIWLLALVGLPTLPQRLDPAKWSLTLDQKAAPPGAAALGRFTATLEPGWHVYSPTTPPGGPIPTRIELAENPAIAAYRVYQQPPTTKFDPNFKIDTETYEGKATFLFEITLAGNAKPGPAELTANVRYQLCTEKECLPPVRRSASATLMVDPGAAAPNIAIPDGFSPSQPASAQAASPPAAPPSEPGGGPAATESPAGGDAAQGASADRSGMARFLAIAFGLGIAAIFTPCVFPMIPITVSFFLRQNSAGRGGSAIQAAVFCLGIIVLFTGLGLLTTALLGPFGVVQLGSNPWVNAFVAGVFLVFGLSLLGAFEITLPSGLLTSLDRMSQRGGYGGTLIMGLTFSLTAFACVGPFVGTLLAASIQGGGVQPFLGMAAFATGLASPFFFLALFPAYLQRLPKSGGWMARVKVVLGFIILAMMFKYISNVDQVMQWGLLTRERFLAIWIVLFAMAGLYLLGFLRLEGVNPDEKVGMGRLLVGVALLAFAVNLAPGMFGGRLGELDAYVPLAEPGAARQGGSESGPAWMKNQYDEALARARQEGKLVFVSFTGYACTNCHWMKANMFTRPEIAGELSRFVLVELYTDGSDEASERNQRFQESRFSTIAIPYYAILDADGNAIATFGGLTRDAGEFLSFLQTPAAGSRTASSV